MDTRTLRKWLPYLGFACLLVGMFGMGRVLPAPLEFSALAVAVLSFAGVLVIYLRSKEKISRVPRKTFWTFMGALFAVALFVMQLTLAQPEGWTERHPIIFISLINVLMWPVIIAGVVVQVRRWHDINASGWWILLNAIPYLGHAATIIVCGFVPGTRGPNRFGADPLGRAPRSSPPPSVTPVERPSITVARSLDQHDQQERRPTTSLPPQVPVPPPRTAAASSLENELRSLAALKADGIISEEEFTAKKRTLLGL